MNFSIKSGKPGRQKTACAIIGVYSKQQLSVAAEELDKASGGYITKLLKSGDIDAALGKTTLLHYIPKLSCQRVLVVGCGAEKDFNDQAYIKVNSAAASLLDSHSIKEASSHLPDLDLKDRDIHWKTLQASRATEEALYLFNQLKSKPDKKRPSLSNLTFMLENRGQVNAATKALKTAAAISKGVAVARRLGDLPGNICTPSYLARQARDLAKSGKKISTKVLEESDMKRLKMGALLSVARGSRQPAKLIIIEYKGGTRKDKPHVLVGKGITFDSGGISLKPGAAMDEMKYDMCGAASVLGTMTALKDLNLPINVIGIIPSSENLPDGDASKPGDIVTSMSGQTIEILNTDAEGRLVLCDALTYAERYKPQAVIDIATLTGACVVALGHYASGLLSNDEKLSETLLDAGKKSVDRAWPMPLWDEYQEDLKSNFADMPNIGGRAGTITAACFLSRFTKKYRWAHLDIAGTAWVTGVNKGATGRPVPLLIQYLLDQC